MATNTQATGSDSPAPLRHALSVPAMVISPPSPTLQYEDSRRFQAYVYSIDFEDNDSSIDHMFEHPAPLPHPGAPRTIPPEELQRRVQDYPHVRGTGLGKGKGRPCQPATPNPPCGEGEVSRVDSVRESPNGESSRPGCVAGDETGQGQEQGEDGNSSDDCAWSADEEMEGGEEKKEGQCSFAACKQDASPVEEARGESG